MTTKRSSLTGFGAPALACALLSACGGSGHNNTPAIAPINTLPSFVAGGVQSMSYDGTGDDLLTAGLGRTGIGGTAPAFADPLNPTVAELRRNAIYTNYRAIIDYTPAGGYGVLYGPNIDNAGGDTLGEGRIAGTETIAYADDGTGRRNVTLMVQVPASFDPARACIITATSSGSRGVYGAIGSAGDWGLKQGCAVAYTDKGTGNGLHDLVADTVTLRDGRLTPAASAASASLFTAPLDATARANYNAAFPNRVAYKHAHSQQNPEKDWGLDTLQAVKLAFYVLNQQFGTAVEGSADQKRVALNASNTLVIASSVSNGAGAALAAAEQDTEGLIDGVAVTEPNAQPNDTSGLTIRQGTTAVATIGKPLADYFTFENIYQPCAALSPRAGLSLNAAFWPAAYTTSAQNRCTALAAKGLLTATTPETQAEEALDRMLAYGWQAESNFLQQSHYRFATNSIAVNYVNAYGRFGVEDHVCGYSFANTDATGAVVPQAAAFEASIFSTGNGVPPTSGVNIVFDDSVGGPRLDFLATSASSGTADFALDGALCLRSLVTGADPATGAALTGTLKAQSDRVRAGIAEVQLGGRLHGVPALIVAGRNDALLPINHNSRAYFALNQKVESAADTRYIEVTNAQHFDTFIAFGALLGYDTRFIPLHRYFVQAMNLMYAHLHDGAALPPSQVVRTTPRAAGAAITAANVPPISAAPAASDQIGFASGTLSVPD